MTEHPLLAECKQAMPKETWEHPLGRPPRAVRKRMFLQVESAEVRRGKTTHWFVWAIERVSDFVQRCAGHKLVGQMVFASGATLPDVMEEAAVKLAAELSERSTSVSAASLHDRAMRLCDLAIASEGLGRRAAFRRAHRLEVEAARLTPAEPSRGILWRSAAWLALDAGNQAGAAWSAIEGLDSPGALSTRIRRELVEVLRAALAHLQRLASVDPGGLAVQLRRSGWLRDDRSAMPLTTTPPPGSGRGAS